MVLGWMLAPFGHCFTTGVGAEVARYLTSGHVVNPSLGTRSRRPVAHGPEVRYRTPSALRVSMEQWFQMDVHGPHLKVKLGKQCMPLI